MLVGLGRRAPALAAGAAAWTATEYVLHRFAMHEMKGRGMASREHLKHHADVTYYAPATAKALSAAAYAAVVLPVSWRLVGRRQGVAFTSGLVGTYLGYEVLHRRAHTHAPATEYGRRIRRSHMQHHFGSPRRNHGVTTTVWDRLLGTYDEPGQVVVPRRMAPAWLLDADGRVRPEHAGDYEVRDGSGRRSPRATIDGDSDRGPAGPDATTGDPTLDPAEQAEQDRLDAFANRPPGVDGPAPEVAAGA